MLSVKSVKAWVSPGLLSLLSLVLLWDMFPMLKRTWWLSRTPCHSCLYSSNCTLIKVTFPAGGHYNLVPNGNPIGTCLWPALTSVCSISFSLSLPTYTLSFTHSHPYTGWNPYSASYLCLIPPCFPKIKPHSVNFPQNMELSCA